MTQEHPITPPPGLVKELQYLGNLDAIKRAYQAGADMELGAGMEWFRRFYKGESWMLRDLNSFKTARRPKPPSLKEQALAALGPCPEARPLRESDPGYPTCGVIGNAGKIENWKTIRAALEALND